MIYNKIFIILKMNDFSFEKVLSIKIEYTHRKKMS